MFRGLVVFELRVSGFRSVLGLGFRVFGLVLSVLGLRFRVFGLGAEFWVGLRVLVSS